MKCKEEIVAYIVQIFSTQKFNIIYFQQGFENRILKSKLAKIKTTHVKNKYCHKYPTSVTLIKVLERQICTRYKTNIDKTTCTEHCCNLKKNFQ